MKPTSAKPAKTKNASIIQSAITHFDCVALRSVVREARPPARRARRSAQRRAMPSSRLIAAPARSGGWPSATRQGASRRVHAPRPTRGRAAACRCALMPAAASFRDSGVLPSLSLNESIGGRPGNTRIASCMNGSVTGFLTNDALSVSFCRLFSQASELLRRLPDDVVLRLRHVVLSQRVVRDRLDEQHDAPDVVDRQAVAEVLHRRAGPAAQDAVVEVARARCRRRSRRRPCR